MKVLLILICCLGLGACSSSSKNNGSTATPGWLSGKDDRYPPHRYWIAVGSGNSHEDSAREARAEISKRLQSKIQVEERSSSSSIRMDNRRKLETEESSQFNRKVFIESQNRLLGVGVEEYFRDNTGKVYALAVLDKAKTLAQINEKIEALDASLETMPATLENSFRAFPLLVERDLWVDEYSALAGGKPEDSPWGLNAEELLSKQAEILRKYPFRLVAEEPVDGIQEMLQGEGFMFDPSATQELKISYHADDYPSTPGIKRVKTSLQMDAKGASGKGIQILLTEYGVGPTREQAEDDSLKKIKRLDHGKLARLVSVFSKEPISLAK